MRSIAGRAGQVYSAVQVSYGSFVQTERAGTVAIFLPGSAEIRNLRRLQTTLPNTTTGSPVIETRNQNPHPVSKTFERFSVAKRALLIFIATLTLGIAGFLGFFRVFDSVLQTFANNFQLKSQGTATHEPCRSSYTCSSSRTASVLRSTHIESPNSCVR